MEPLGTAYMKEMLKRKSFTKYNFYFRTFRNRGHHQDISELDEEDEDDLKKLSV